MAAARKGKGRAKKPPLIADPAARDKLEAAAAAAGLSVQELADLVFESGVTPAPTSDGITERYTIEDLGTRLWGAMQTVPAPGRAAWFASLVPMQQVSVVVVLRDRGYRTEVIAKDLGIEPAAVMRTWNTYASQLGSQVVGIRLDTIAGQLQMASERAQQMAIEDGDHSAYWRIEKEKVELLQSIGVVEKAIHRTEVTHKIDDAQKAEIEALFELRNKQQRRLLEVEEIKQVELKGDDVPDEVREDYDDDD